MAESSSKPAAVQPGGFKIKAAAIYCGGLHVETLRRAVKRGVLKPSRVTRHLLFSRAALDEFLSGK